MQRLVREIINTWPGIEKTGDVAGGEACIVRTRKPGLVARQLPALRLERGDDPGLRAADLVNAWGYVDAHREEIDRAIQEDEAA